MLVEKPKMRKNAGCSRGLNWTKVIPATTIGWVKSKKNILGEEIIW